MPELSIVVPCRDEADSVPELARRFEALRAGVDLELIVVDNASSDATPVALARAFEGKAWAKVARSAVNLGYGGALRLGLSHCRAPVVAFTHGDLQTPPEDVLRAYHAFRDAGGRALVKGRRLSRAPLEGAASRVYRALCRLALGFGDWDVNAQPKVFPRELLARLEKGPDDFTFDAYALFRALGAGLAIREIEVRYEPRRHGASKWSATLLSRARAAVSAAREIVRMRTGVYG